MIGDSVSDLEMAPAVRRLWITANGAAVDGMAGLLDAVPNVIVTDAAMGEGWAQAVRASLQKEVEDRPMPSDVDRFLAELEPPLKAGVEQLRARHPRVERRDHRAREVEPPRASASTASTA